MPQGSGLLAGPMHAGLLHLGTPDPCAALIGSMYTACENTGKMVSGSGAAGGGVSSGSLLSDPLGSIASGCAQAAAWVIDQVSSAVGSSTSVDFTNAGFLKQYGVVFAASAVLTLVLWLLAVIKRAVRGEPVVTAISEATGFLWLAVGASAFTPVVLYGMVKLTDGITTAIGSGTVADRNNFLTSFANTLSPPNGQASNLGGGPILLIFISLVAMIAAAVLWIELLIRAAMLYVGAALAAAVYAGLVDKSLWHHIRRWAGMMIAVDLAKPVIVIVLGLATAISASQNSASFASVLSGLAIMILSIVSSALIFRFVPNFGDDMLAISTARNSAGTSDAAPTGAMAGPASRMREGIAAHGARSGNPLAAPATAALSMSAGMAAHGARAAVRIGTSRVGTGGGGMPGGSGGGMTGGGSGGDGGGGLGGGMPGGGGSTVGGAGGGTNPSEAVRRSIPNARDLANGGGNQGSGG